MEKENFEKELDMYLEDDVEELAKSEEEKEELEKISRKYNLFD